MDFAGSSPEKPPRACTRVGRTCHGPACGHARLCRFDRDADLVAAMRRRLDLTARGETAVFSWSFDDPAVAGGVERFDRILTIQRSLAGPDRDLRNALRCDGQGIDHAWCAVLASHGVELGLEIDGPEDLHEARHGPGSHAEVLRAIELARDSGVVVTLVVPVSRLNAAHPLPVYRFLRRLGVDRLHLLPVVEADPPGPAGLGSDPASEPPTTRPGPLRALHPDRVEPIPWGRFLCAVFDEWLAADVGRIAVAGVDVWTTLSLSRAAAVARLLPTPSDLALMDEGCGGCRWLPLCRGGCPRQRVIAPSGGTRSYLCQGWRMFFRHAEPAIPALADLARDGRPTADIMRRRMRLPPPADVG